MRISDWSSDVCSSDLGAYGGLTCFYTTELTRDAIFDCLRRRHHYGPTGCRLHLDVRAVLPEDGQLFECAPNVFTATSSTRTTEVMLGGIVRASFREIGLHAV